MLALRERLVVGDDACDVVARARAGRHGDGERHDPAVVRLKPEPRGGEPDPGAGVPTGRRSVLVDRSARLARRRIDCVELEAAGPVSDVRDPNLVGDGRTRLRVEYEVRLRRRERGVVLQRPQREARRFRRGLRSRRRLRGDEHREGRKEQRDQNTCAHTACLTSSWRMSIPPAPLSPSREISLSALHGGAQGDGRSRRPLG